MMGCIRLSIVVFAWFGFLLAGGCAYGQNAVIAGQSTCSSPESQTGSAEAPPAETKPSRGLRLLPVAGMGGSIRAGVNGNLDQIEAFAEAGVSMQPADGFGSWQLLLHAAGGWLAEAGTGQLKLALVLALPSLGQLLVGCCTAPALQQTATGQSGWFPVFAIRTPIVQYQKEKLLVNLALDLSWTAYLQPNGLYLAEGYCLPLAQDDFMRGIQAGLALAAYCRF